MTEDLETLSKKVNEAYDIHKISDFSEPKDGKFIPITRERYHELCSLIEEGEDVLLKNHYGYAYTKKQSGVLIPFFFTTS